LKGYGGRDRAKVMIYCNGTPGVIVYEEYESSREETHFVFVNNPIAWTFRILNRQLNKGFVSRRLQHSCFACRDPGHKQAVSYSFLDERHRGVRKF
jgi:hypothetical protein